jgi:hypothetical protein
MQIAYTTQDGRKLPKSMGYGLINLFINGTKQSIKGELVSPNLNSIIGVSDKTKHSFKLPRVILFDNPNVQNLIVFDQLFDVEVLCLDALATKLVSKLYYIKSHKATGQYIQAFAQVSAIVIAPSGFIKNHKIIEGKTKINFTI